MSPEKRLLLSSLQACRQHLQDNLGDKFLLQLLLAILTSALQTGHQSVATLVASGQNMIAQAARLLKQSPTHFPT